MSKKADAQRSDFPEHLLNSKIVNVDIDSEMRKSFLIHMTVCYCIDLASYIGMYFIPTYWVIPLTPMTIVLYLIAIALCVVALRRMGKDHEDRPKTAADRSALHRKENL